MAGGDDRVTQARARQSQHRGCDCSLCGKAEAHNAVATPPTSLAAITVSVKRGAARPVLTAKSGWQGAAAGADATPNVASAPESTSPSRATSTRACRRGHTLVYGQRRTPHKHTRQAHTHTDTRVPSCDARHLFSLCRVRLPPCSLLRCSLCLCRWFHLLYVDQDEDGEMPNALRDNSDDRSDPSTPLDVSPATAITDNDAQLASEGRLAEAPTSPKRLLEAGQGGLPELLSILMPSLLQP